MRISDWSSDVCSSDLGGVVVEGFPFDIGTAKPVFALLRRAPRDGDQPAQLRIAVAVLDQQHQPQPVVEAELGADDEVDAGDFRRVARAHAAGQGAFVGDRPRRSEEHTSELQSLMRLSYAVFCLKKK